MKQTNKQYPPIKNIYDHLNAGTQLSSASLAEYREGHLQDVHAKVIEAKNHLWIAEQMLAHAVFLLGESG